VVDNFTLNGTELDLSSGDFTLDVAGDIILDADGGEILFHDNTTAMGHISMASSNITIKSLVSDKDIIFQGNDGGSGITALTLDMSAAGAATFNDKIIATELDISGAIDVAGTTNLDVVDIDGAVQLDATLTIGANDQGYDVIIYGDTASANLTWDTSADDLILNGGAGLIVPDGQLTLGSTAVTSTAAELNLLDTAAANSVVNSKAVIYGSSGELAGVLSTAAQTNVTSLGTLTALTVDDVAINTKSITMTGSSSDTAVFTAGTNGTLTIVTTDDAAAAANITITADGTAELAGTTVTLNSGGDISLNADGAEILFDDGSTNVGHLSMASSNVTIKSLVSDKDIIFQGNDGGSGITALTLDMSAAGNAAFNADVTVGALFKMPDNTSTKFLVADGTSYQEVAMSGDATMANTGAVTIASTAIEGSMLNNNVISGQTALTSGLALDDEIFVSDGGVLKRMDISVLTAITDDNATALAIALG